MLDLVLSLLALIAGGFLTELFAAGSNTFGKPKDYTLPFEHGIEELQVGNPS